MKKYKAIEVAKELGVESKEVRELITKIAMDRNISEEYIDVIENGDNNNKYYFYENSLTYIRNYLFLYGIFGTHKVVSNILNHKLNKSEVKGKFNRKIDYIGKKYSIYKNLLYNELNLLEMILDKNNDFYSKIIEDDNKLLSVKVIEEIEKNIEKNPKQLIDLIKAQIEIGELLSAKENIEKIIELTPDNLEVYFLKAKVLLRLMNKPNKKINSYKIMQEGTETSSAWHAHEELIHEEYDEIEKLKRNRYDTYLKIYNLLKKSKSYSSYKMKQECENEIFRSLYIKYFYNSFISLDLSDHLRGKKEKLKKYRETGVLELPEKKFDKSFVDMILDIVFKPDVIDFRDEDNIKKGILALHFYFLVDYKKYIEYADFYFDSLKNMEAPLICPFMLSEYLSHTRKDNNTNNYKSVFQEHFNMNLSKDEIIELNEKINKRSMKEAESYNEARALNVFKVNNFKKLYNEKKYLKLISEMEDSLNKLIMNCDNYVKISYSFMELINKVVENNIKNQEYSKAIENYERILIIDKVLYRKYSKNCSAGWTHNFYTVEGGQYHEYDDIFGNYFESPRTIEKTLENLAYKLEDHAIEGKENKTLKKIKKFLHV